MRNLIDCSRRVMTPSGLKPGALAGCTEPLKRLASTLDSFDKYPAAGRILSALPTYALLREQARIIGSPLRILRQAMR